MTIVIFILLSAFNSFAISTDTLVIPVYRQYYHDKINKEQKLIDNLDGKQDSSLQLTTIDEVNTRLTDVLFRKVNELKTWVELNDKLEKNNDKIRALGYLENTLVLFRAGYKKKEIPANQFPLLFDKVSAFIKEKGIDSSIIPVINDLPYNLAKVIVAVFEDNIDNNEAKKIIYFKFCALHPDVIFTTIKPYVNEPFADSLIGIAGRNNPVLLYTYAQSLNTPEGKLIHSSKIPFVQTIASLSLTPNSLLYFPFLDDILSGKNTIERIHKFVGDGEIGYDSVGYFKLLIKTEKEYFRRLSSAAKDTPIAMFGANGLRAVLKDKAVRHFITPINNLHEENNLNIRMKAIDSLTAEEIYFMIVLGENEIFTSSYKHSFNRMLLKLGTKPRGDSLLLGVKFDFFKKFIKMSANYNRLDTFLRTMPHSSSEFLMKAFVANLDQTENLEDATDVADSYGSINNPVLQKTILSYVEQNENKSIDVNNERGAIIYGLLKNIFMSSNTSNIDTISKIANIPSIYEIARKNLEDDSGRIVEQVFFYGDEDGKMFFAPFVNSFYQKEWKVTKKAEWVEIKSLKSKVSIFANLPLDFDANLDDSAQVHLNNYLSTEGLAPSIVVHRGHSYWLPGTIKRMPENAKIVLLGSCGGYKNLHKILEISPDAHIVSTKEIGAGDINRPIFNYLNQTLLKSDKIVWKEMWSTLTTSFSQEKNKTVRDSWESYIPPYKNLGAIFIKAYNKKMESQ